MSNNNGGIPPANKSRVRHKNSTISNNKNNNNNNNNNNNVNPTSSSSSSTESSLSSSSSSSSSSASTISFLSSATTTTQWNRLPIDLLRVTLSNLTLREFAIASLNVCTEWQSLITRRRQQQQQQIPHREIRNANGRLAIMSNKLIEFLKSRLRVHYIHLHIIDQLVAPSPSSSSSSSSNQEVNAAAATTIKNLSVTMPNLMKLQICFNPAHNYMPLSPLYFSTALREIVIDIPSTTAPNRWPLVHISDLNTWTQVQSIFDVISTISTITHVSVNCQERSSMVELNNMMPPVTVIQSMKKLAETLQYLSLTSYCSNNLSGGSSSMPSSSSSTTTTTKRLTSDHITLFCELTSLTYLNFSWNTWNGELLYQLCKDNHPYLKKLEILFNERTTIVNEKCAEVLIKLPSLKQLEVRLFTLIDTSFLTHLTQLSVLKVFCTNADITILVHALKFLTQLTKLKIEHAKLTSEHMCDFLPCMWFLEELHLSSSTTRDMDCIPIEMHEMKTLAWLSQVEHLSRTITTLRLNRCPSLTRNEFKHLFSLRSLQRLSLDSQSCDDNTLDEMMKEMKMKSKDIWPNLRNISSTRY